MYEKCTFGRLFSVFVLENWKTKRARRSFFDHKTRSRDIPSERSRGLQYPLPFGQHSGNPTAGAYKHGKFMYTYTCIKDYFVNVYCSFSRKVFDSYRIFGKIYSATQVYKCLPWLYISRFLVIARNFKWKYSFWIKKKTKTNSIIC